MKKILSILLLLVTCSLFAQTVAYLNMEKVFNGYYKTLAETIRIEEARQNFVTGLGVLREELENTEKEYQQCLTKTQSELLTPAARQEATNKAKVLEVRLQQKEEEFLKYRQQRGAELEMSQQRKTQELVNDLHEQLKKYASANGYDLVYEVSGKSINRVPVLLVYPEDKEITEAFSAFVNQGHEQEKADAQAKLDAMTAASAAASAEKAASDGQ